MIQASNLDLLAYLEDNEDKDAKSIEQKAKMEITKEVDMIREEESIKQETIEEEKEEWSQSPYPFHP